MKLFFSVGEPSGDLHGANLIRELKAIDSDIECVGYGGPKMKTAGCDVHNDLTRLAVMWFLHVLLNLRTFWNLLWQADRFFKEMRPDAVILIDYPGFNWWIARRAKARNIPVFYYGTPQMWAWAGWRVRKMQRFVDFVLCKLPFEVDWYRERGCEATYVGHPYFDELKSQRLNHDFMTTLQSDHRPLVTILPGSRNQEVRSNLKWFLQTAERIHRQVPYVRFAIAAYQEQQAKESKQLIGSSQLPIAVYTGKTAELIASSHSCLACSGSVSLELLYHQKPSVIHYHVGRFPFFVQLFFRKVRYITLVNLLANDNRYCSHGEQYDHRIDRYKVPFPEYLTATDKTNEMAKHIVRWLNDSQEYDRVREQLSMLRKKFVQTGASRKAAEFIHHQLNKQETMTTEMTSTLSQRAA